MRVLLQRSHHDPNRVDGWSGAPGEATFIRQEVIPTLAMLLASRGVTVTIVNGDYAAGDTDASWKARNPDVALDYDLFLTPHYEANIHGVGGWFAGRAAGSTTPADDDWFLALLRSAYAQIPGVPAQHPEWSNPNVTDYYAFRCTSLTTPGALIELGVGAPGAPDHDWLRANALRIAGVLANVICEFGGITSEDEMTEAQMQELKDFITAERNVTLFSVADMLRRSMRGEDMGTGFGTDPQIAAGEQINPSNGR